MALQGTLEDFGIADIFQLIGQQQKTGVLVLAQENKTVHIYFRDGCIVQAEVQNRDPSELLGEMLVLGGLITQSQLKEVLVLQKKTLQKLGAILLERNFLHKSDLDEFIYLQTKETIFRLFRWRKGTYQFHQQEVQLSQEFFQPISAEHILMDGFRMIDEWPSIRKQLPNFESVLERVPGRGVNLHGKAEDRDFDAAFDSFVKEKSPQALDTSGGQGAGLTGAETLSPSEQRVYELVDGKRNIQNLIGHSRLGEFETCHALVALLQQEFIRVADVQPVTTGEEKKVIDLYQDYEVPGRRVFAVFSHLGVYVTFLFLVGFLMVYVGVWGLGSNAQISGTKITRRVLDNLTSGYQGAKLELAVKVFAIQEDRLPPSLDVLTQKNLIRRRDLSYPWPNPYRLIVKDNTFHIDKPF